MSNIKPTRSSALEGLGMAAAQVFRTVQTEQLGIPHGGILTIFRLSGPTMLYDAMAGLIDAE